MFYGIVSAHALAFDDSPNKTPTHPAHNDASTINTSANAGIDGGDGGSEGGGSGGLVESATRKVTRSRNGGGDEGSGRIIKKRFFPQRSEILQFDTYRFGLSKKKAHNSQSSPRAPAVFVSALAMLA